MMFLFCGPKGDKHKEKERRAFSGGDIDKCWFIAEHLVHLSVPLVNVQSEGK